VRPVVPVRESPAGAGIDRLVSATFVLAAVASCWLLASIDPDARGHGTHERLGLAPCSWPIQFGKPCPTCGVTTAATLVVHLSPWRALTTQPFGAALAFAGLWLAIIALLALIRRESLIARISLWPLGTLTIATIAIFLFGWATTWLTWPAR